MNTFWSRHPWLRRATAGLRAFLVLVITALLSIAYVYMPPEDRTEAPAYLTFAGIGSLLSIREETAKSCFHHTLPRLHNALAVKPAPGSRLVERRRTTFQDKQKGTHHE